MPLRTKPSTAAPPVTATEVAVLGLLADGESSGYDLLRAAERSVGFFWTPAKTQLYAILKKHELRLLEKGPVKLAHRPGTVGPKGGIRMELVRRI